MNPKQKTKASKFLSLILRHKPQIIKLTLDENGWASTNAVVKGLQEHFSEMSLGVLKEIVAEDEKQRYSFNDKSYHKIRANQGHSIKINLNLVSIEPPEHLFHGTAKKNVWKIMQDGILPMDRQYVHLSVDRDTAKTVGARHGDPVVLSVKSDEMAKAGLLFYRSDNGVWLTDRVPMDYLAFEDNGDE